MENIFNENQTLAQKRQEDIQKLKEKLKQIKEQLYKMLMTNSDNKEFFDEIFNLQNEVLSSEDIREARLEKEFNQILKVLNLLHSIQDSRLKNIKEEVLSLLQDYLDTKEQLLELTEINCTSLQLIKKTVEEIKNEINQMKNKSKRFQNTFIAIFNVFGKILKVPIVQKAVGIFFMIFFAILFLYFIKHLDKDLYNDTKDLIKNTVTSTQSQILNK